MNQNSYYINLKKNETLETITLTISNKINQTYQNLKTNHPTSLRTIEINKIIGIETAKLRAQVFDYDQSDNTFKEFKKTINNLYNYLIINNLKELEITNLTKSKKGIFEAKNFKTK